MNKRVNVFMYGRYMNHKCMKELCRHAEVLNPATLKQYRLTERRYADIDPDAASEIYGVLYSVTPGDKKKLDRYAADLRVFAELEVEVAFGDKTFRALTYMMTPEGKKKCDGIPYSNEYIGECRRGAAHYMVPNSFRYANVIVYGSQLNNELEDLYCKDAVAIRPCTITGTLYDSGYDFALFSPEGNTAVEAEYLRIPRDILEKKRKDFLDSPFKLEFLVAAAPDGSTFGGWAVCLDAMPPRAKVIESGHWREQRKLKFDTLMFSLDGNDCNAKLLVDFTDNSIYGQLERLSPDDPEEEINGMIYFGKYWRKELLAAFRECHFERWPKNSYSNGNILPAWFITLKKGEDDVKLMVGRNIFPFYWDTFLNVVRLCFRLCQSEDESPDKAPEQGPVADTPELAARRDGGQLSSAENELKPESARKTKPKQESAEYIEPELPLFDDLGPESVSGLFPAKTVNPAVPAAPDKTGDDDPAPDNAPEDGGGSELSARPDPDDVEAWFFVVMDDPGAIDSKECPYEQFSLEQWKDLILDWPFLLQYDPPAELRSILTKEDFECWSGAQVCEALFFDGQWLADLFPMENITQEDFDNCFSADCFEGPDDYWEVVPKYFPNGFPPQIKLPFPKPGGPDRS